MGASWGGLIFQKIFKALPPPISVYHYSKYEILILHRYTKIISKAMISDNTTMVMLISLYTVE